jgi:hypothetical protein
VSAADDPTAQRPLFVFGAFDRFNFGDLLFPLLLQRAWPDRPLRFVSLRAADFSSRDGVRSEALGGEPGRTPALPAGGRLLVCGGEVLAAEWFLVQRYLWPIGLKPLMRLLETLLPGNWLNRLVRRMNRSHRPLPFVPDASTGTDGLEVAYNAVGGIAIDRLDARSRRWLTQSLQRARHLSVRDRTTLRQLADLAPGINAGVSADSGILVADLFPVAELASLAIARTLAERFSSGYMVFQSARYLAEPKLSGIVEQLRSIARSQRLGLVLLPLGLAAEHEDQVVLEQVAAQLPEAWMPGSLRLSEMLAVIAGARLFAGTSLHGNITAIAYAVPHIGLTDRVPKLTAYLDTWSEDEFARCHPYSGLSRRAEAALRADPAALLRSRERQLGSARHSMQALSEIFFPTRTN